MKNEMTVSQKAAKKTIRFFSDFIDFLVLVTLVILMIFAGYSLWDSQQVFQAASSIQYEAYKPDSPEHKESFAELVEINPDVMGWLTIYGTSIDYPLVQSKKDNDEYMSRNPKYEVESSGSLFLDHKNKPDFSDFNSIIFGHHMAQHAMFGDIDLFLDKEFFDEHKYGDLYYSDRHHGLEIVAIVPIDAYDDTLYVSGLRGENARQQYIGYLKQNAKFQRMEHITTGDHLVLMSTCSADITNGRFVLVAKILDRTVENPFPEEKEDKTLGFGIDMVGLWDAFNRLTPWNWILIVFVLIILLYIITKAMQRRRYRKEQKKLKSKEMNRQKEKE